MPKTSSFLWKMTTAAALVVLAGCSTPAAFAPRESANGTGYTDRQLATNRYRVSFRGNSVTPRETVEDDLMLRAAQVTLAAGSGHFLFDTRDTRANKRYDAIGAGPGIGWGGGWRFGPRWGYGGFGRGGYGSDVDIITTTSFEAYAEIVLLTDAQAAREPRAIDARQVVARLTPPPPIPSPPAPPV